MIKICTTDVRALEPQVDFANEATFLKKGWFDERNTTVLRDDLRASIWSLMLDQMVPGEEHFEKAQIIVQEHDSRQHE